MSTSREAAIRAARAARSRMIRNEDLERLRARLSCHLEHEHDEKPPLRISDVVMCETVWVLVAAYHVPRAEVGDTLGRLLMAAQLCFDRVDRLSRALEAFVAGKGDFADYVIREQARAAGCDRIATFDRVLLKETAFIAP